MRGSLGRSKIWVVSPASTILPGSFSAAGKPGRLIEMNPTKKIFSNPEQNATEAYISGRFG